MRPCTPVLDISSGVSPFLRLTPYRSMARTKLTESVENAASDSLSKDCNNTFRTNISRSNWKNISNPAFEIKTVCEHYIREITAITVLTINKPEIVFWTRSLLLSLLADTSSGLSTLCSSAILDKLIMNSTIKEFLWSVHRFAIICLKFKTKFH